VNSGLPNSGRSVCPLDATSCCGPLQLVRTSLRCAHTKPVIQSSLHGATTVQTYSKWFPSEIGLKELVSAFGEQTKAVIDGDLDRAEAMLTVQAHTLDTIYNSLARKAMNAELLTQFETYLKLALRAQSQCRSTWEAISAIKNPPVVGYVSAGEHRARPATGE